MDGHATYNHYYGLSSLDHWGGVCTAILGDQQQYLFVLAVDCSKAASARPSTSGGLTPPPPPPTGDGSADPQGHTETLAALAQLHFQDDLCLNGGSFCGLGGSTPEPRDKSPQKAGHRREGRGKSLDAAHPPPPSAPAPAADPMDGWTTQDKYMRLLHEFVIEERGAVQAGAAGRKQSQSQSREADIPPPPPPPPILPSELEVGVSVPGGGMRETHKPPKSPKCTQVGAVRGGIALEDPTPLTPIPVPDALPLPPGATMSPYAGEIVQFIREHQSHPAPLLDPGSVDQTVVGLWAMTAQDTEFLQRLAARKITLPTLPTLPDPGSRAADPVDMNGLRRDIQRLTQALYHSPDAQLFYALNTEHQQLHAQLTDLTSRERLKGQHATMRLVELERDCLCTLRGNRTAEGWMAQMSSVWGEIEVGRLM